MYGQTLIGWSPPTGNSYVIIVNGLIKVSRNGISFDI